MERASASAVWAVQLETLYTLGTVGSLTDDQLLERFLARTDKAASEAAFAALVERHGPMVLSVCRRIVAEPHDADDAFQATFLVLARRARSIHGRGAVAAWLFGIARRVASRARADAIRRRRQHEKLHAERLVHNDGAGTARAEEPEPDYSPLIAAIDRLPERFRTPIVLHYFEGLSAEVVAQRLGCARGTVLSRLARARERLRRQLGHRGVSLDAVLPTGAVANRLAWKETVPSLLVQNTIRAAASLGLAGAAIESVVPATVAALALGVARALVFSRARTAVGFFILAAVGVSFGIAASLDLADEPARPPAGPRMASSPRTLAAKGQKTRTGGKAREDSLLFRGQVLDPDGKPVTGAAIVVNRTDSLQPAQRLATSGADGRFEATVPLGSIVEPGADDPIVSRLAALAPGFGPAWVKIDRQAATSPISIHLLRDDVPIEGRLLGLEGRGVPGAKISVYAIASLPDGLLAALRTPAGQTDSSYLWSDLMQRRLVLANGGPPATVRTGPDGRFRMTGVGRNRVVTLTIEGESIEESTATVLTFGDPTYKPLPVSVQDSPEFKLLGPRFELTAAPGRVIEGIVRDRDTGRPIPGARVGSTWAHGETTCDGQGRFRLTGMPKAPNNFLKAVVDDQPYVRVIKPVRDPQGLGPVQADVELKRGVWATGKVINRSNGRPVKAIVKYLAFRDNPHLKDYPGAAIFKGTGWGDPEYRTGADGRFRAVALPGGGVLVVRSLEPGYLTAKSLTPEAAGNVLDPANFEYQQGGFQALVPIHLRENEVSVIPDITLTPGRPQHVRPVGPDGRPVERTLHFGEEGRSWLGDLVPGPEFTFVHPRPGKPETVVILGENRELAAFVDIKGDEPDPMRVVLRPVGTIIGRLVDADARPRPNVRLELGYERRTAGDTESEEQRYSPPLITGPDGRFRIRGLVPGLSYTVAVIKKRAKADESRYEGNLHADRWTVKPGEVQDWGDVRPSGG